MLRCVGAARAGGGEGGVATRTGCGARTGGARTGPRWWQFMRVQDGAGSHTGCGAGGGKADEGVGGDGLRWYAACMERG